MKQIKSLEVRFLGISPWLCSRTIGCGPIAISNQNGGVFYPDVMVVARALPGYVLTE